MPRGRPVKSEIRQNLIEILFYLGEGYGYDLFKIYRELFPACTNEVIYYHLKKGVQTEEFVVKKIAQEKGDYSWGGTAEKIYYKLGPKAQPRMLDTVGKYVEKLQKKREQ